MRRIAISIAALAVACASCGGPGPLRAGDRGATAPTDGTTARIAGTEGRAPESASRPAGGGIASPGRHGARSESGRSFGAGGGGDAPPVSAPEDSGTEARPETDDGSSSCNRSDGCSATENGANEPDAEPAPPTTPPNQEDPPNR